MVPFHSHVPSVVGDAVHVWAERDERRAVMLAVRGGPGRIRTSVGVNRRVYSPFPLATRAPTQRRTRYRLTCIAPMTLAGLSDTRTPDGSVYFDLWLRLTLFRK